MGALGAALQRVLPKRAISSLTGSLTRLELGPLTRLAIRTFVRVYDVDLHEAAEPEPRGYRSFNAFFTRALAADARPLEGDEGTLVCPADGRLSEQGSIESGTLIQAKGRSYTVSDLLDGDTDLGAGFEGGHFWTVYLAPRNYHRVHVPLAGQPRALRYVPGTLFSVNDTSVESIPRLFCRNERVAVKFDTEGGAFALVMVGALNVGSIELSVPAPRGFRNRPAATHAAAMTHAIEGAGVVGRGVEHGRFNMGSTVILLTSQGLVHSPEALRPGDPLRVGQALARRNG